MTDTTIRRGFVDVPHGQTHYRHAGEGSLSASGEPLLIIHASPGSSRQQVKLIADFAGETRVLAPDTPGNGDSDPLPGPARGEEPTIPELASAVLAFLDASGVEKVHVYGSHTGASIAAELAILAPARVSRLVLDGVSLLTPDELADILSKYAFPFDPDLEGAYLIRIFQFCRDQYMFFPWYNRTRAGRRDNGLCQPADLHAWVLEVMKGCQTYHLNYRAAFKWDAEARLPLVACPTLVIAAENDPLYDGTEALTGSLSDGRFIRLPRLDAPDFAATRRAAMAAFLKGN
ncbi:MAG TPA: alpha/beta hydrolase [Novosphingobium sp.]|nr:alpha/beta hydrolase [Novosphingobium sp.]